MASIAVSQLATVPVERCVAIDNSMMLRRTPYLCKAELCKAEIAGRAQCTSSLSKQTNVKLNDTGLGMHSFIGSVRLLLEE